VVVAVVVKVQEAWVFQEFKVGVARHVKEMMVEQELIPLLMDVLLLEVVVPELLVEVQVGLQVPLIGLLQ